MYSKNKISIQRFRDDNEKCISLELELRDDKINLWIVYRTKQHINSNFMN